MNTTNWRSTIWQKLFSIHSKDEQHRHEKARIGDEEEAHELLPSSRTNTKDADDNSDSPPPYVDEDEDDKDNEDIESNQQKPKRGKTALELEQSEREKGCASRRASLLAAIILIVFLLLGLLILSRVGFTGDASDSETTTYPYTSPSSSSPSGTAEEDSTIPTTLPLPSPTTPSTSTSTPNTIKPHHPIIRHSWTSLTPLQQHSYIAALQCLRRLPPLLPHMPTNASAYSDYPYVHAHIGYRTHNSASFLPWHRYFLSLYERRLRESCGYDGGIPYWDWSADADAHPTADLSSSAVFDDASGFGGNGAPDGPITAGRHGRCVATGPFAALQVLWYDVRYQPHCLSRGFRTDNADTEGRSAVIDGSALTTAEIDKILGLDSYEAFVGALEKKVHDVIPFGVGGDFETFSAPFEPLFWLHHAQLDRLWYVWQRQQQQQKKSDGDAEGKGRGRVFEYGGHKFRHSIEEAGLDDLVEMGGVLGVDVKVRELMDVEGGCAGGDDVDAGGSGILCVGYV